MFYLRVYLCTTARLVKRTSDSLKLELFTSFELSTRMPINGCESCGCWESNSHPLIRAESTLNH